MATKLFLRNTIVNGVTNTGDGICYDLNTQAGAVETTGIVNTTASGNQFTKTAGGLTIAWISERVPAGGFTLTSLVMSAWYEESNSQANVGERYTIYKYNPTGPVITLLGTFDPPNIVASEFTTSATERTLTCDVPDTAFAEDERILIRAHIVNIPAAGALSTIRQATIHWNGADGATGDSFANIAETVDFKPVTVAGAGSAAGVGAASAGGGAVKETAGTAAGAGAASAATHKIVAITGTAAGVGVGSGVGVAQHDGNFNFAREIFDNTPEEWLTWSANHVIYPRTLADVAIPGYVWKVQEGAATENPGFYRVAAKTLSDDVTPNPHPVVYKWEGWFRSTNRHIVLGIWDGAANYTANYVNLTTGAEWFAAEEIGTGFTIIDFRVEAAADGYWHITLIAESNSATEIYAWLSMYNNATIGGAYAGDGVSGLFVKDMSVIEYDPPEGWYGEATMEFVGTTPFIDMIEAGDRKIGYSAEIILRAL